jgi:hypothetical protein
MEDIMKLNLSAPTTVIFIISLVIALLGILVSLAIIPSLPIASFWVMAVAYAVLAIGCLFKGA